MKKLLLEKPLNKITINDITESCVKSMVMQASISFLMNLASILRGMRSKALLMI